MPDEDFDQVFPPSQRMRSNFHWTPIEIALRACELLDPLERPRQNRRVLDIGSGVGKLCLVGALTTEAVWCGIERDAAMVRAAVAAAKRMGLQNRVEFMHGELSSLEWSDYDSFYLFNPFAECLFSTRLDPLERRDVYYANIQLVQQRLATTKLGTRVVTYHGFGGDDLPGFTMVLREPARESDLCLWIRS